MRIISEVVERLKSLLRGHQESRELDEEIRFHIDREAARLQESGMSAEDARRAARVRFGGMERTKERAREARGVLWVQNALTDLRLAHRGLVRTPGQSLAAVVTLALGIGVATTMFGTIYGAFYRALPFDDAEHFVYVERLGPRGEELPMSYYDFVEWEEAARSFRDLGAAYTATAGLRADAESMPLSAAFVTWNAPEVLGTTPELGRSFRPQDDLPGAPLVAVLSHRVWEERFSADPAVVGREVVINGEPATLVGVMPDGFHFPETQDLWVPMRLDAVQVERGEGPSVMTFGHLAPGVTLETANGEIRELARRTAAAHPETNEGVSARVRSFRDLAVNSEALLINWMLMLAALAVLLIACMNVANLLLGRAAVRMREVALRSALGARRAQIILHMLAESLALALYGGVLGAGIGWLGVAGIRYGMRSAQAPYWVQFKLDTTVLLFTAASAAAAGLIAGLLPALRATMGDFMAFLKDASRGSTGLRIGRISRTLVGVEVAFSVCLLFVSGLMTKSVLSLARFDRPFAEEGVFVANIDFFDTANSGERADLVREALDRARELPGVADAALASGIPGGFVPRTPTEVEGRTYASERDVPLSHAMTVSPGFFELLEVSPVAGRVFNILDDEGDLPVALVNQSFAQAYFGGLDPIGRRVRLGGADGGLPWRTVVGVVPDLLMQGLANVGLSEGAGVYVPARQSSGAPPTLLIRSDGSRPTLMDDVQVMVRSIDPELALFGVSTLRGAIDRQTWYFTLTSAVFVAFGAVALFLACVGLLGVVAFESERRTQEVGVRLALGAKAGDVVRLVLGQGLRQMVFGIAAGVLMATGLARAMVIVLFETRPNDPSIYAITIVAILAVGALASLYPALRAARTDPARSLQAG